jgi:hypothetical protein
VWRSTAWVCGRFFSLSPVTSAHTSGTRALHDDGRVNDEAYARELQAILTNQHPRGIDPNDPYGQAADGIDRYDGFGRDVWVESLKVVQGEYGAELEVNFGLAVPEDSAVSAMSSQGSVRVPFDREWRRLSGYEDPAGYAPEVARRVVAAARGLFVRALAGDDWWPARQRVRENLPDRREQWRLLLAALAAVGSVTEPSPGRIVIHVGSAQEHEDGDDVTLLLSPDQWEEVLVDMAGEDVDMWELFGSRPDDEIYLVFYDGELVGSTREELPPVRSKAVADMARKLAARSRRP